MPRNMCRCAAVPLCRCAARFAGACAARPPQGSVGSALPAPSQARGIVEFVIDVIWTVFWIVSASLATALLNDDSIVASSKLKASVA